MMEPEPLNIRTLDVLKEMEEPGGEDFLGEIIDAYVQDTEGRIRSARNALESGDARAMAKLAHAIKGSSLNVGAEHLASLAYAIEKDGKAGLAVQPAALAAAEREFERVKSALSAYRGRAA